jgi:multidrug efflux pump subunit AcrB
MNFARRATIALVTGILTIGGFAVMASPAEAQPQTNWPQMRADTSWPV